MNIDTNEIEDVHVYQNGYFRGIDDKNEWLNIQDGNYEVTFVNNEVKTGSISSYEVPLWLKPTVICKRILLDDITPLFSL